MKFGDDTNLKREADGNIVQEKLNDLESIRNGLKFNWIMHKVMNLTSL